MDENLQRNYDFYNYLPKHIIDQLETLIKEFESKYWFEDAWEEYRQYVLDNVNKGKIKLNYPGHVFNKYLRRTYETNAKLRKTPIKIQEKLWRCSNCNKLISNREKPDACPHCGLTFIRY